ncbi:MAG: HD domain-containing protein [Candidatus Diapherotrites archaeon]|nr:HD domain-containing protein [Candidatus Diapherotrites archaeon]
MVSIRRSSSLPSVGKPPFSSRLADAVFGAHSRRLNKAMQKCVEWHRQQKRKDGTPYAWHPFAVLANLKAAGVTNKEILIAGLLHDTVEDKHTSYAEVRRLFGPRVMAIVKEVSKDENGSFNLRTKEGMTVKMADRLHNLFTLEGNDPMWVKKQIQKSIDLVKKYGTKMEKANPQLFSDLNMRLTFLRHKYDV